MSLNNTKKQLHALLLDSDNKVIALTGKWGTGKSHLWEEVSKESNSEVIRKSLYVSLFGLTDLPQAKIKIMQCAIFNDQKKRKYLKAISSFAHNFKTILKGLHKSLDVLDELTLIAAPAMLKDKFIVIDDMERKHEKLSIDEILGFIDEFSQKYNSRFLIILNSDKLENRPTWDVLREKVIDHELRLSPSAEESFSIALTLTPSSYAEHLKKAVASCKINNIRIIRRIIKNANVILDEHDPISNHVLSRVIPPLVLLSAISFNGLENGPDFKFVLSQSETTSIDNYLSGESELPEDDDKLKQEWRNLLDKLGIFGSDNFEILVVDFLESGHINAQGFSTILAGYANEQERFKARVDVADFKMNFFWNSKIDNSELLCKSRELIPTVKFLSAAIVTELHDMILEVPDGAEVAENLIKQWILNFTTSYSEDYENENTVHNRIHKDIQRAIKSSKQKTRIRPDLLSTITHILKTDSWDTIHEAAMSHASPMDFESVMVQMDANDLKDFMAFMIKVYNNKSEYEKHFLTAGINFYKACQLIINDGSFGRLSKIVDRTIKAKIPLINNSSRI